MKKLFFSLGIIGASALYMLFGSQGSTSVVPPVAPATADGGQNPPVALLTPPPQTSTPQPAVPAQTSAPPPPTPVPTPVRTPVPTPTPTPQGQYADGTYTGGAADAYYGMVQVQVVVQGGQITNVKFLQYPNTHSTSVFINEQAMPYLTQEAIQAQSANVNIISGATDTSIAFQQSLASALAQAKA